MSPIGGKRIAIVIAIIIVTIIIASVVGYFLWNMFLSLFGDIEYGIEIRSDEDFLKYDFSGTGSSEDPYIIEDYVFTEKYMGILIQNVTKSFIIDNCTITESNVGISLNDIRSAYALVINNEIANGSWFEVGAYYGIEVRNSSNILIENNIISRTGLDGITITFSENCTMKENEIEECNEGIEVDFSSEIICIQNNISLTSDGIVFSDSFNVSISGNSIDAYYYNGLEIHDTNSSYITGNSFTNLGLNYEYSGTGLYMRQCIDMTINNNTFKGLEDGILIYFTTASLFTFNLIENCNNYGLSFYHVCLLNEVYLNAFIENSLGNSQGYDYHVDNSNRWYNEISLQGNYWSDYIGTGNYTIDGAAEAEDIYPLLISPL